MKPVLAKIAVLRIGVDAAEIAAMVAVVVVAENAVNIPAVNRG